MRLRLAIGTCGLLFAAGACSGDDFSAVPGGASGTAGEPTSEAGFGGSAGDAGQGGAGPDAGAGGTDAGGASGGQPTAGSGGQPTAGSGGQPTAGSGGQPTAGSGGQPTAGAAGVAGAGGSLDCDLGLPTTPPTATKCGNGVVEAGEDCDDANTLNSDGCVACKVACPAAASAKVDGRCYFPSVATEVASEVYVAPDGPDDGSGGYIRIKWDKEICSSARGNGTHLAQFDTAEEWAAFRAKLPPGTDLLAAEMWIAVGARWSTKLDVSDTSFWFNSDGGNTPLELWRPDAPTGPASTGEAPGGLCGVLGKDGLLGNVRCFKTSEAGTKRQALCEREPVCALIDSQAKPVPAQIGYRGANGHCYAKITPQVFTPGSWDTADAVCKRFGAHLVRFEDPGELDDLRGAGLTSGEVWVGAQRKVCANNDFVWSGTNVPVPLPTTDEGSRLWGGIEPNNGDEKCAAMDERRRLADLPCDYGKGAFCERDF
jgi:cysteine-rich repeat protein